MEDIKNRLTKIEERNKRVELDKKWETSTSRKLIIMILTYMVISLFFIVIKIEEPFINALVPTTGFFLSTLTLGYFKKIWIKRQK